MLYEEVYIKSCKLPADGGPEDRAVSIVCNSMSNSFGFLYIHTYI